MTKFFHNLILSLAALVVCSTTLAFDMPEINLPDGFQIEVLTDQVPGARSMALGDKGTLFVSTMREGKVYAVSGTDSQPEYCQTPPRSPPPSPSTVTGSRV